MRTTWLNLAIYGGLCVAAYGFWLAYPPLGYIVGGLCVAGLGVFVAWFTDDKPKGMVE